MGQSAHFFLSVKKLRFGANPPERRKYGVSFILTLFFPQSKSKKDKKGPLRRSGPENVLCQKDRPSPPVSLDMVSEASASAARMASLTAATIMSWSISTSSGSTA